MDYGYFVNTGVPILSFIYIKISFFSISKADYTFLNKTD